MSSPPDGSHINETVTANGVTHHAPLLVCRPVRPEDYSPDRLRIWDQVKGELGAALSICGGSIFVPCEDCGIMVALGPRQQATVEQTDALGLASHVVCMIDASVRAVAPDRWGRDAPEEPPASATPEALV